MCVRRHRLREAPSFAACDCEGHLGLFPLPSRRGKEREKVHMGGFHGLCLEVVHITSTHIRWIKTSSRDHSWQQRNLGNAVFGSGDLVRGAASQGCFGEFLEKR